MYLTQMAPETPTTATMESSYGKYGFEISTFRYFWAILEKQGHNKPHNPRSEDLNYERYDEEEHSVSGQNMEHGNIEANEDSYMESVII